MIIISRTRVSWKGGFEVRVDVPKKRNKNQQVKVVEWYKYWARKCWSYNAKVKNILLESKQKQNEAWSSFPGHEFFETEDLQCVSVCVAEVVKVIEG